MKSSINGALFLGISPLPLLIDSAKFHDFGPESCWKLRLEVTTNATEQAFILSVCAGFFLQKKGSTNNRHSQ